MLTYRKLSPREHVLSRTAMYAGAALGVATHWTWTLRQTNAAALSASPASPARPPAEAAKSPRPAQQPQLSFEYAARSYAAVLLKMLDEVLVNAYDHAVRSLQARNAGGTAAADAPAPVRTIAVTVDAAMARITVQNDGDGIDVRVDEGTGLYVPELVFGHLLAGSNFDDEAPPAPPDATPSGSAATPAAAAQSAPRMGGGMNGIGSKIANILSSSFTVVTVDRKGRQYQQTWRDNMAVVEPPSIKESAAAAAAGTDGAPPTFKTFTRISFVPDMARLGYASQAVPADTLRVLERRVWDLAACCCALGIRVSWQKRVVKLQSFAAYAAMHLEPGAPLASCDIGDAGAPERTW